MILKQTNKQTNWTSPYPSDLPSPHCLIHPFYSLPPPPISTLPITTVHTTTDNFSWPTATCPAPIIPPHASILHPSILNPSILYLIPRLPSLLYPPFASCLVVLTHPHIPLATRLYYLSSSAYIVLELHHILRVLVNFGHSLNSGWSPVTSYKSSFWGTGEGISMFTKESYTHTCFTMVIFACVIIPELKLWWVFVTMTGYTSLHHCLIGVSSGYLRRVHWYCGTH